VADVVEVLARVEHVEAIGARFVRALADELASALTIKVFARTITRRSIVMIVAPVLLVVVVIVVVRVGVSVPLALTTAGTSAFRLLVGAHETRAACDARVVDGQRAVEALGTTVATALG